MNRFWAFFILILSGGIITLTQAKGSDYTKVSSDERVVLFTTSVYFDANTKKYVIPIHGWMHELEGSFFRKGAFKKILKEKYKLQVTPKTKNNFDRRVQLFLADNERGKKVVVSVGGKHQVVSPQSGANGHFKTKILLTEEQIKPLVKKGAIPLKVILKNRDKRAFKGQALWVEPGKVSIISDIDDTVKITQVTEKSKMLDATFFQDFKAAPGMAELYQSWQAQGYQLHFVSSSPWHLWEPLDEFLTKSGFPLRTLSLKMVRLKDKTILDLFKKGTKTKPLQIEPLLQAYPDRKFILVGDSGEQDPEVYNAIYKKYPSRIQAIYIRNVTQENASDARFKEAFKDVPKAKWKLFDDPKVLKESL